MNLKSATLIKVIQKTEEAISDLTGNKIENKIIKTSPQNNTETGLQTEEKYQ